MNREVALSASLIARALSPPLRLAPLSALARELRRPGAWLDVCRIASQRDVDWLHARMLADDPLVRALGATGDPVRDPARARAGCFLALALCGLIDERPALAQMAETLGELPAPQDLASLDATTSPLLADIVADLRGVRQVAKTVRVRTVVDGVAGGPARGGSVVVTVLADHAAGLRPDAGMGFLVEVDEHLARSIRAVTSDVGELRSALLARVEDDDGELAGGDACHAALLGATWVALGGQAIGERPIVGAFSRDGRAFVRGQSPPWPSVEACLASMPATPAPFAPSMTSGRITAVDTPAALRRALGRSRAQRRLVALAAGAVSAAAVSAIVLGGSPRSDNAADRMAGRAEALLAADPGAAALAAARALAASRSNAAIHAALRITASAALVETVGTERGRLNAVAIDDRNVVTTVSNAGRATRWSVRGGRALPFRAVPLPRNVRVRTMSRSGRWLLIGTDTTGDALLVDAAGKLASRRIRVSDDAATAVSDGRNPSLAVASGGGEIRLRPSVGRGRVVRIDSPASALAFSPDGRLLAIGTTNGRELVLDARSGAVVRGARHTGYGNAVTAVDVDDRGTTISEGTGVLRSTRHVWRRGSTVSTHYTESAGAVLAGPALHIVPDESSIVINQESLIPRPVSRSLPDVLEDYYAPREAGRPSADRATAKVQELPSPVDSVTTRRIATAPSGAKAVLAQPAGRFAVIDLRRVVPTDGEVADGLVAVGPNRLSALGIRGRSVAIDGWDLRSGRREARRPVGPGAVRFAAMSLDGLRWAESIDGRTIRVRELADDRVVTTLASPGTQPFVDVALDGDGSTVAAAGRDRAVALWRLQPSGAARLVARVPPVSPVASPVRQILALSPDGRNVVHGDGRILRLIETANGRARRLATPGLVRQVRVRFSRDGRRLGVAGDNGAVVLSGRDWKTVERYRSSEARDAVPVEGGVAVATVRGLLLLTKTGADISLSDSRARSGSIPGTIMGFGRPGLLVPTTEDLPIVLLRQPETSIGRLCNLAGREGAGGACAPPRRLPAPVAAPSGERLDETSVLGASGLGPVRLGQRLPGRVRRLPGYRSGRCAVRSLPGLAAAVVTRAGIVETIALFAGDDTVDGPYEAEAQLLTDLGMTVDDVAVKFYGKPHRVDRRVRTWYLRRGEGQSKSVLRESRVYPSRGPSITMSVQRARCDFWS